jgi:transposase
LLQRLAPSPEGAARLPIQYELKLTLSVGIPVVPGVVPPASLTSSVQMGCVFMNQATSRSSPVDPAPFMYVVGMDIGSQTCSFCTLKPDKSQVIKPTDFANAPAGFAVLLDKLERLGVPAHQILMGLEATSRYEENLYRLLESRGYQLCLLHPRQTHQFAQQRGLRAKTDILDAGTIARVLLSGEARRGMCRRT